MALNQHEISFPDYMTVDRYREIFKESVIGMSDREIRDQIAKDSQLIRGILRLIISRELTSPPDGRHYGSRND